MIHKTKRTLSICKATLGNLLLNQNHTHCHSLWDSVYVHYTGDVYSCVHCKPGIIGNIYEKDLMRIFNKGKNLHFFRLTSLHKSLHCFKGCKILSNREKKRVFNNSWRIKYPRTVRIRYGLQCNLRCIMCSQNHRTKITIDNNALKNNIDWSKIDHVSLEGGEILAMKNAKEFYLWLTEEMNKKVNIITNGTLINDKWVKYLLMGSREIQISVNASTKKTHELVNKGSCYEKVILNIIKLTSMIDHNNLDTRIIYKYTIVPENILEIADAIALANSLGCDRINYGYSNQVPSILERDIELRQQMKSKIDFMIKADMKIEIEKKTLERLGLTARRT